MIKTRNNGERKRVSSKNFPSKSTSGTIASSNATAEPEIECRQKANLTYDAIESSHPKDPFVSRRGTSIPIYVCRATPKTRRSKSDDSKSGPKLDAKKQGHSTESSTTKGTDKRAAPTKTKGKATNRKVPDGPVLDKNMKTLQMEKEDGLEASKMEKHTARNGKNTKISSADAKRPVEKKAKTKRQLSSPLRNLKKKRTKRLRF